MSKIRSRFKSALAEWKYRHAGGEAPADARTSTVAALEWLCLAQSATVSGGFSRAYSLTSGWESPYPETTGYIIPTLLAWHPRLPELHLLERAQRAGTWLAEVQFESGAICSKQWKPGNTTPSVFNTGMVLHGWVSLLELERAGKTSAIEHGATVLQDALTRPGGTLSRITGGGCGEAGPAEPSAVTKQQALTHPSGTLSRPTGEGRGEGNARLWDAARKAADWLTQQQEPDGSWVKAAFNGIPHTYYTMVDWALLRYALLASDARAREAAVKNLDWTLRQQKPNGWFDRCSFSVGDAVTTHTLSYTTQGLVESALLLDRAAEAQSLKAESRKQKAEIGTTDYETTDHVAKESRKQEAEMAPLSSLRSPLFHPHPSPFALRLIEAAVRATEPLRRYYEQHDTLPGTFDESWNATAAWECCTGNAQTSLVWQALGRGTGDKKWIEAATRLNERLLQYQKVNCRVPGINGAIPGSWPINGGYDSLAFPNHAAKFHIDALSAQS